VKGLPSRGWALAGAAGLLLGAAWLRSSSGLFLIASAIAAGWTAFIIWRHQPRPAAAGFVAVLLAFAALEAVDSRRQSKFAEGAAAQRSAEESRATAALSARLAAEADQLRVLAVASLDVPADPALAFSRLEELRAGNPSRAVAVARGGSLAAWAGHYLAPIDSLQGPVGVVANEFYILLYAIAGRDRDRAVATSLIHAEAPADSLAVALDRDLVDEFDVGGFAYGPPTSAGDSAAVVSVAGVPVLSVRAIALGTPALAQRLAQRGSERGLVTLAFALVLFLIATWRSGDTRERYGALGVTLGMIAIVPLADLSNRTALFNPTYFFVSTGGPLTASIGALALTAATVLVAVLAAQRGRMFPRRRWQAGILLVVAGVLGPFLLANLTGGIKFPANGASVVLWLAWETSVFLAALVILYVGLAAGEALMGPRRWIPAWLPPFFAAAATALAPAVTLPRGGMPQWYTLIWIVGIVMTAIVRQGRSAQWAAATVAAFGSVTLVWNETVKARVQLAEQDVAALSTADPAAAVLARRFPAELDSTSAPRNRVDLLARYARSDLASSDFPVIVTSWSAGGQPQADLRVGMAAGKARGLEFFAREASEAMKPVLTTYPGEPGMLTILAYPHADRSVTTVVVAPRTRLVLPNPFPMMTGLSQTSDEGGEPPYTLQPAQGTSQYIATAAQWTRRNEELRGEWYLPPSGGQVIHLHASVPLSGYGALISRGGLLVCANLAILGFLWVLVVIADGGAVRLAQAQGYSWLRSYRARLTVSLFLSFMLPASSFAWWSYSRLQDEDIATRDLLVRETLRGVTGQPSTGLDSLGARFDTPLFLFANGILVATSDPLFDALAPIGRLLPAPAARALIDAEQGFATAEIGVGGQPLRFGFRVLSDSGTAATLVLGAPARTAELALDPRRRDLAFFVVFATVVGALGALWISGIAGRTFARPIGELREGAIALAAGQREPRLAGDPPLEFEPVFNAFREMARDLESGRARDARAQRVLAWGEMARQVAHEIKNPLTPMRLGVQHLQRAKDDPRLDFKSVFDENAERLLNEIDRLDEIARAFSRYGTAPDAQPAAVAVDVADAVRDVVRLEQLGAGGVKWEMEGVDAPVLVMARATELREVLLNLLENARLADAKTVKVTVTAGAALTTICVTDDGHGIAADAISRVFEPHFSTRTSGSGLGLAITRRLVDGWGGSIAVDSTPGVGTTLTISLVPASSA
jgi:two-component system nitrogen regulation sensor histidine kinase NtrY